MFDMNLENRCEILRVDSLGMPLRVTCCGTSKLFPVPCREFSGVIHKLPLNG